MTQGPRPWFAGEAAQAGERRHAPATLRNRDAIVEVLRRHLPERGTVLEVASGSGEHAVYFAEQFPGLEWQPSDPDPAALASIAGWAAEAGLGNVRPPVMLDAQETGWPVEAADALLCINKESNSCDDLKSVGYAACLCINMVHISEWAATVGLFRGCAQVLQPGAPLFLYGPYIEDGVETALSNLEFEKWLKSQNPNYGIRKLVDVDAVASEFGFVRIERVEMPANNLSLIYRKSTT